MDRSEGDALSRPKLANISRKAISLTSGSLVHTGLLEQGSSLPLVMQPAIKGLSLTAWAADNRSLIDESLNKHGALLFRNFNVKTAAEFEAFIKAVSEELLEYRERSSPRSQVSGSIYTSTDYPASESIFLHNENSYQNAWPMKLFFFCARPADAGGETPIADCRRIYERIPAAIRDAFITRRWMYVRNFGERFGLPWQTVFQTENRQTVDEYCRASGIETEWRENGRLRTRAIRDVIARHPRTGEFTWFNHATFFHVSTLSQAIRQGLLEGFKNEEELPANTYYGDGSPIEPEVLDLLRNAYRQEMIVFPWQRGDILMLDNMLVAHARMPYQGDRSILVGMADPHSCRHI